MVTLPAGAYIGQYEILHCIAQTTSSHVYAVQCSILKAQLALKISTALDSSSASAHTFLQQANLMHQFSGAEHIINVMHVGSADIQQVLAKTGNTSQASNANGAEQGPSSKGAFVHYIVMPYLPQNLAQKLAVNDQKISLQESLNVMQQLFSALNVLHSKGVLHNDIKPQNVLINNNEQIYLSDFDNALVLPDSPFFSSYSVGLKDARSAQGMHKSTTKLTVEYASPELKLMATQNTESSVLNVQSDLYSAGALWFRMLHGAIYQGEGQTFIADMLLHRVPNHVVKLIMQLLHQHASDRPISAKDCLQQIIGAVTNVEDFDTEVVDADSLLSNAVTAIEKDIRQIWQYCGEIDHQNKAKLMFAYQQHLHLEQNKTQVFDSMNNLQSATLVSELDLLIQQAKQYLIDTQGLASWFAWVNTINAILEQKGRVISRDEYQQLIQTGLQARPSGEVFVEAVLKNKFTLMHWSFARLKKILVPIILIVAVFVYWQWSNVVADNQSPQQQVKRPSVFKEKEHIVDTTELSSSNAPAITPKQELNNQQASKPSAAQANNQSAILARLRNQQIAKVVVHSSMPNSELAEFELVILSLDANFAVMRTEVSNQLYQLCINDGACRKRKQYSTGRLNIQLQQPAYPKVNVSWFDVTQEFIPWINQKTSFRFTLPSYEQWQSFLGPKIQSQLPNVHCKDCTNNLSRQNAGTTITTKGLAANSRNLFGVLGNVQEWLSDCWQDNKIARCDQAMVIGGSWIDKQVKVKQTKPSQLLKRATTPTTGFRLIMELNDE